MKKYILHSLILMWVVVTMASCFGTGGNSEPTFSQSDLYSHDGLWQEENTKHYVRFTSEKADTATYLYGREWDEAEDVFESDLVKYGNGWFKYQLVQTNLTEIHLMDNGGAAVPKVYVVTMLTNSRLEYYDKGLQSAKYKFNKVSEYQGRE